MATGRPQSRPAARPRVAGERARARAPQASAQPAELLEAQPVPPESTTEETVSPEARTKAPVEAERAAGPEPAADEPRRRRLPRWLPVVSAVLIAVFLATTGILAWRLYEGHAREVSRNDVLRIVPSYTAKIFSFDYRHLDQDADGARPLLVGTYRRDYDASMKRNAASYRKYHYVVKSDVASAGVSDAGTDRVRVVTFIDQTVTAGAQKPGSKQEETQLGLTFERHGGKWLLAKVEALHG